LRQTSRKVGASASSKPLSDSSTTRVHAHTEALVHPLGQAVAANTGIGRTRIDDELQHRRGELVGAVGTGLVRDQRGQATLLEGRLGLVERRTRETTGLGRFGDRALVDADQSQHLVLDLQHVVGIEEFVALEQRVNDAARARVERCVLPQQRLLVVVLASIRGHGCTCDPSGQWL
jgi:hypothetical protein